MPSAPGMAAPRHGSGADDRAVFRTGANTRPADRAQLAHAGRRIQSRFRGSPPPETLLCDGAQLVFRRAVARGRQQFAGGLPSVPKPALDQVRRACRPLCASARIAKFDWTEGELFEAEVWLLNDRFAAAGPFSFTVTLRAAGQTSRYSAGKALPPGRTATSQAPRRARHSRHGTQTVSGSKSPSKAIRKWMPATRWPTAAPPANRRARHR